MAEWADLPQELLNQISQKTNTIACHVRFKAVCRSWRSAATTDIHEFLLSQPPWLMIDENQKLPTSLLSSPFFSFISLTEPKNITDLEISKTFLHHRDRSCLVGCTGSWLIKFDKQAKKLYLMNPFSHVVVDRLPSLSSVEKIFCDHYLRRHGHEPNRNFHLQKVVLSVTSTKVVAAAAVLNISGTNFLAFAHLGDNEWRSFECRSVLRSRQPRIHDAVFYNGEICAVNELGEVFTCDISGRDQETVVYGRAVKLQDCSRMSRRGDEHCGYEYYLVEVMGDLMMVLRFRVYIPFSGMNTQKFKIFKLDAGAWKGSTVNSLENYSMFLGMNTSTALPAASSDAFEKNCVYFADNNERGPWLDTGVFSLEIGRMVRLLNAKRSFRSLTSPPVWMIPSSIWKD